MPPWMRVELLEARIVAPPEAESIARKESPAFAGAGSELTASYRLVPSLPFRTISGARIIAFAMNDYFEDIQTTGPFKSWHHRHQFHSEARDGINGTVVQDVIDYDAGYGKLGDLARALFIGPQLARTFQHRQKVLEKLLDDDLKSGGS